MKLTIPYHYYEDTLHEDDHTLKSASLEYSLVGSLWPSTNQSRQSNWTSNSWSRLQQPYWIAGQASGSPISQIVKSFQLEVTDHCPMKRVTGSRREEESVSERDRHRTNYTTLRFNMSCLDALLASGCVRNFLCKHHWNRMSLWPIGKCSKDININQLRHLKYGQ